MHIKSTTNSTLRIMTVEGVNIEFNNGADSEKNQQLQQQQQQQQQQHIHAVSETLSPCIYNKNIATATVEAPFKHEVKLCCHSRDKNKTHSTHTRYILIAYEFNAENNDDQRCKHIAAN